MKKTKILISIMCILTLIAGIGVTYAIIQMNPSVENKLVADTTKVSIEEAFDQKSEAIDTVKKEVRFKNEGSSAVFLRFTFVESWTLKPFNSVEEDDAVLLSNQVNEKDVATKNWTQTMQTQWVDGNDHWYYYTYILEPGETTSDILTSVSFPNYINEYEVYGNADYQLYFKVEAAQASTSNATINKDEVNTTVLKEVFHKEATLNDDGFVAWK